MPVKSYKTELLKSLSNKKEAVAYLNACLEDSEEVFLQGIRNVVEANGGMSSFSKLTELNRENLYRSLSSKGNPKFSNLSAILKALGIKLTFKVDTKKKLAA